MRSLNHRCAVRLHHQLMFDKTTGQGALATLNFLEPLTAAGLVTLCSQSVIDTDRTPVAPTPAPLGEVMSTKIVEPVRARRCLLPVYVFAPGNPAQGLTLAGLVDTGAVHSAIDPRLAAILGLPVAGPHTVSSAGGQGGVVPAYRAVIDIWRQGFGLAGRGFDVELSTLVAPMVGGTLLIGMDILQHGQYGLRESGIWDFTY